MKVPLWKSTASASSSRTSAEASAESSTPIRARPSTCAWLAAMSCTKNSRSSRTSVPARKRMMRGFTCKPGFCHSNSFMGNGLQFGESQGEIQILHCLRRRALEQVIQRRHHYYALAARSNGKAADFHVMSVCNLGYPGRFVDHAHQWLLRVTLTVTLPDRIACHGAIQPQVYRHRDAAKMWRHMRHEFNRQAKMLRHFALVGVIDQRVRHQVVAQLFRIIALRRCRAGAGIAGDAETGRRRGEHVLQWRDRELHRRCVTTGIAYAALRRI